MHLVKKLQKYQQTYFYCFSHTKTHQPAKFANLPKPSIQVLITQSDEKIKWYQLSHHFWKNTSSNVQGVMMGRSDLSNIDIQASSWFIDQISRKRPGFSKDSALDCGGGIGRVCSNLLRHRFKTIDMVEKCEQFVKAAQEGNNQNGYRHFYCCGLENFNFQHDYDAIWIQWVFTHLQDEEILTFLLKAQQHLKKGGVIFVKDNYCQNQSQVVDCSDCTIVRSDYRWKSLFYQAKRKILDAKKQEGWPQDLYPVKMWALI